VPWKTGIFEYAKCFETGFGTKADEEKAATLYLNAAEAGSVLAMETLADRYARGACSLVKDEDEAEEWAERARQKRKERGKKKMEEEASED
jgi:TPR repeat protein